MVQLIKILILALCLLKICTAQVYFNNRYDNFNNGDITTGINNFNQNYLIYGCAANSFSFYSLNLGIVDANGIRIKNKTYNWGSNLILPNINKCIINSNNSFMIGGSNFYKPDTSLVFFWKFDANLDSIKYFEFGYLNKTNQINGIIKDDTKYLYMTGWVDSLYKNQDILLIKTDTSGNEIWKKKIGLTGWDEYAYTIKISSDNKLLIAGNKRTHGTYNNSGAYILKADTSGAVIWEQYFPSNHGLPATDIVELSNGEIVYSSSKGFGSTTRMQLIKLTSNGNLIFNKVYGNASDNASSYSMLLNHNNNLVAVGQNYYSSDNTVNGLVYEFNQNGDSLFSREYAVEPGSQNYFRDVVQAPDRGYVFSGFISPLFANGGTGTQDIWLLKTDSTFCESAVSCGYPTGILEAEPVEAGKWLRLYPNPANDELHIDFLDATETRRIEIYDSYGKLVLSEDLLAQHSLLNTHYLSGGIYFYRVISGSSIIQNKLVITR